jgi:hypothetical protein
MKKTQIMIAVGLAALSAVLVLGALNPLTLAAKDEDKEEDDGQHVAMQIDIANEFAPFGQAGFFKLLADFTDLRVEEGHVAISNVQCDEEGTSPFAAVIANANVGAGNTQLALVALNSTNIVDDVSFPGTACTYHFDVNGEDYAFPVTDIALANGDDSESHTPISTASATIQTEIVEIDDDAAEEDEDELEDDE